MESKLTKKKISNAFIELCELKGYSKVSVQEIAIQAHINRQTFYYHFNDKHELLGWVCNEDALKILQDDALTRENWEDQALKIFEAINRRQVFYKNLVNEARDVLIKGFFEKIKQQLERLINGADVDNQLLQDDVQFYSRFFAYGCCGIIENWIVKGFVEPPITVASQFFQLSKDVEVFSYRLYQEGELSQ